MIFSLFSRWRKAAPARYVGRPTGQPRTRLFLEVLEARCLLTTVMNLNDADAGSLRQASSNSVGVGGIGGGIRNFGTLTVSGCALNVNSASFGGGILNAGTLTVT